MTRRGTAAVAQGESAVSGPVERALSAWSEAWNDGRVDALDDVFAPDYRRTGLLDSRSLDREEMKALILDVRSSFPDLRSRIGQCLQDGDRFAILWNSGGTHLGEYGGAPPTGKTIETSGASFYRVQDGLVVEEIETWDPRDVLATLGIRSLHSVHPH